MKKLYLILSIFLALALLSSCGGNPEETTAPESSEAEPEAVFYNIVLDGACDYTIIRPDILDSEPLKATIALRKEIADKYGVSLDLDTDWSKENKENNTVTSGPEVHEILIGNTNRAESRAIAEEYPSLSCGYVIKAVNGKVVIWGSDAKNLTNAIDYFMKNFLADTSVRIEEGYLRLWDLNGEGMPLDLISKEYSIIYANSDPDRVWNASNLLSKNLGTLTGAEFTPALDKKTAVGSGKEILVGNTDRPESAQAAEGLGYMDYTIRTYKDKIAVVGGSPLATEQATRTFVTLLSEGKITSLEEGFVYDFSISHLIADSIAFKPETFTPSWAKDFTPAAWMLDPEEKLYALTCPTGRMTADAHRGDVQNYPENSLEGILSAIRMGCDVIELDIRLTKDNIMVLMHDASLKRTTDWNSKKGMNGLPSSDQVSDWTFEELCQLRLLYNGKATEYRIPTMYEAALLFAGTGSQIHFDCKVSDNINKNSDVYLLAEATGSKQAFLYYYGIDTMATWLSYNKDDTEFKEFVNTARSYLKKSGHALRKRNYDMIAKHGDHAEGWQKAWDEGYKMTFTNKIYDFCRFVSANQEPIPLP